MGLARLSVAAGHVAAELVTQAVTASGTVPGTPPVRLWPRSDRTRMLVAVWDASPDAPAWPDMRDWPFAAVAEERGWHPYRGGRTCWSVLSWRDGRACQWGDGRPADRVFMSTATGLHRPFARPERPDMAAQP